jgi:hypothetical protein
VRGPDGVSDVIVVRTVGAELGRDGFGRRSRRRSPRPATDDDAAEPVTVTRVTVVRGAALGDGEVAREWLAGCQDVTRADSEIAEALRLVNRALHAHRVSAGDPYVADLGRARARRVRLGFGSGDELVEGRWREALEVPKESAPKARRRMLAPEDQLARILGGRRDTYPSEELLLRARLDIDQGRIREAALQARAAHGALSAELEGEAPGSLDALAGVALERDLTPDEAGQLEDAVAAMERVVRRRRHADDADR